MSSPIYFGLRLPKKVAKHLETTEMVYTSREGQREQLELKTPPPTVFAGFCHWHCTANNKATTTEDSMMFLLQANCSNYILAKKNFT